MDAAYIKDLIDSLHGDWAIRPGHNKFDSSDSTHDRALPNDGETSSIYFYCLSHAQCLFQIKYYHFCIIYRMYIEICVTHKDSIS